MLQRLFYWQGCLLAGAQGLALASRHTPRSLRCKRRMTCSIEPRKNNTCMGTLTNYASHNIIADAADHNQDGGWETHQHGDDTNNRFGGDFHFLSSQLTVRQGRGAWRRVSGVGSRQDLNDETLAFVVLYVCPELEESSQKPSLSMKGNVSYNILAVGSLPSPRDSFLTFGSTFDSV